MTELQRKSALKKVHTVNVEERSNEISAISQSLQESENPLLQRFAEVGVDWIARDVLFHIVNKAAGLEEKLTQLPGTELETFVVPSSSNPKKPHVVVFMANGKCECQDCPGYSSLSICAHAVAVSLKLQRLEAYLKWLVTKHRDRKTGGVSYSRAITYGMPKGRGRKPNQATRKRGRRKHPSTDNVRTFPRIGFTEDRQFYPQAFAQSTPFPESIYQFNNVPCNEQANYPKE